MMRQGVSLWTIGILTLALTFHEETKHSYESVYHNRHFLDWTNQPQPFKRYLGLEAIPLPADLPMTQMPALWALSPPGETGVTTPVPTLPDLAYVLFYAAGVTKRRFYPGHGEMLFRAAACTGALYHIDLYLSVCDVPGLQAGLYHFDPHDFALRQLRQGDYRRVLVEASGDDPALQEVPVIIIGSDTFWRNCLEVPGAGLSPQLLGRRDDPRQSSGCSPGTHTASPPYPRFC